MAEEIQWADGTIETLDDPNRLRISKPSFQNVKDNLTSGAITLNKIRNLIPKPPEQLVEGLDWAYEHSPLGIADKGAQLLGDDVSQFLIDKGAPKGVGTAAALAIGFATPGIGGKVQGIKGLDKARKLAIKSKTARNINLFPPNQTLQPQLATVGPNNLRIKPNVSDAINPAKPLQIASDMKPANWHGPIEALSKSPGGKSKIVERLSKPYHKDIKGTRFEHMTLEDLADDKGGWLTKLIGRSKQLDKDMARYKKAVKEGASKSRISEAQRAMYDNFTFNPGSDTQQIYARTNPIRKAITGAFNQVAGKEWHHIFGNKEAAEAMLTKITQDPYIAVNLLHHIKRLKLPTSGTPENIALMLKKLHRKKGGYHNWAKELGLEGRGKKADAVFDEYVKAISESVLDGTADAKEVFTIFESYAKLNKFLRKELKSKYGAQVISEMNPVMKYIQRGS
tara:strand:+ start:1642 stop:2997 length:1356 start_codon:yes stop_codon:yes gene_type:complete